MMTLSNDNNLTGIYTIGFFAVSMGGPPHGAAVKFDTADALCEIDKLGFVGSAVRRTRYMHTQNDKAVYTAIVRRTDEEICFKFCEVNRGDLPQIEEAGIVEPLPLAEDQGLMHATHCIAFRPGLIGAVLNIGPPVSRLAGYIRRKKVNGPTKLQVKPLVHRDVIERLNKLESISLFQLKLSPSQLPVIRGAWRELDNSFEAQLGMWSEQATLEVVIRPLASSQRSARGSLLDPLISLARRSGLLSSNSIYKIRGKTEGQARDMTLNILSDALTTEEEVKRISMRDEALDDASAFHAITRAYEALKTEIDEAEGYST